MAIERAIFDLDLTLYRQKDADHHTRTNFYETRLGILVAEQIVSFVSEQEGLDDEKSQALFEESKADPIGPSAFLGERYGLTRLEYFTATWGQVDVGKLVDDQDAEIAQAVVARVVEAGVVPVLLTAGPRPWATKVMARLGITDAFTRVTYGEEFGHKREVFAELAVDLDPAKQISIGDDYKAEIEPAVELGMHGYHVNDEQQVEQVPDVIARIVDEELLA